MMEFDEPSDGMMLDMNIVQSNPGPSVFFYDSFEINVIFPPTPVPTMAPVTGTPTGTPTSLPTMMPTTATPTMAPTPLRNIYEIGVGNDSIVAELALQAGLADALSDPNATLTLLAPDNSAFEALPPKITAFLTANTTILQGILLGHVLGIVADSTLVASLDGQEVTFLSGSMATVNVTDAGITVGEATVTTPDILASNGIVHIVDRIIGLPTILEGVAVFAGALVQAFNAARLSEEVDALNGVTLFAPTTAGFLGLAAQFSDLTGAVLTNDGFVLHSRAILSAHIFPDVAFSFDLMDGMNLTMLDGSTVTVSIDDLVQLSPGSGPGGMAAVVAFDIPTTQGVVHGIDAVITPSFLFTSAFDVASMLTPTLASLLVSAGLESAVASTFGITVFAPEDSALEGVTLTGDALVAVLSYHVVPAVIPSINIADGETAGVPTLLTGSTLSVVKDAMGVAINGVAMVIAADKLASNGIVHVIDAVLFPPVSTAVPTTMPTAPSAAAPVTMTMAAAAVLAALALC
jgi:transforming growth factor-beta-induced protein